MRFSTSPRISAVLCGIALAVAIAGCGDDGPTEAPVQLGIIQNLAVDQADGRLVIATPSGLYSLGADADEVERLGTVGWNVRGLAATGPRTFLASGNSTRRDPQPPRLGLQRSTDGGRTWRGVALVGKEAFDAIRISGTWIYGLQRARARALVSRDRGKTWRTLRLAEPVVDLAVDPSDPRRLVVSYRLDSFLSVDGGRSWRPLGTGPMLLAWPARGNLYGVAEAGEVWRSDDRGLTWGAAGDLAQIPVAFAAGGPRDLYAALSDATILRSPEGGNGWDVRVTAAT